MILQTVINLFKNGHRSKWPKHNNGSPQLLDARRYAWGTHVSFSTDRSGQAEHYDIAKGVDRGTYFSVWGHWPDRPRLGDRVIKLFASGPKVLEFVDIEYCDNPNDMFFGTVKFLCPLENLPPET